MTQNSTWLGAALALAALVSSGAALAVDPEDHLEWADLLVDTIDPAYNVYGSNPVYVYWEGYDGHSYSENRSKCSSFMTNLLDRAYDVDMTEWMGCSNPLAVVYHDTIGAEDGFTEITDIDDVQAGDIIAIEYLDAGCTNVTCSGYQTCSSTGHVAMVSATPTLRSPSTSPVVADTLQYNVLIIDSSASYHGSADTRYAAEAGGGHDSGVGEGTMRVYTDSSGTIVGYTWSTYSNSTYYDLSERHLVIGRYDGSYDGTGS